VEKKMKMTVKSKKLTISNQTQNSHRVSMNQCAQWQGHDSVGSMAWAMAAWTMAAWAK